MEKLFTIFENTKKNKKIEKSVDKNRKKDYTKDNKREKETQSTKDNSFEFKNRRYGPKATEANPQETFYKSK